MAETTDKSKASSKPAEPEKDAKEAAAEEKPAQKPPHLVMRALLGFAGLSLLVGFFLPWVRYPAVAAVGDQAAVPEHFQSGLDLLTTWPNIQGTSPMAILVVPILGALLSAASFMGFRYAGQTAMAVAVGMLAYGLYVLGSMFIQFTGYGLWTVAGGTFVILLLGVATYMLGRRGDKDEEEEAPADAKKAEAPKAAKA